CAQLVGRLTRTAHSGRQLPYLRHIAPSGLHTLTSPSRLVVTDTSSSLLRTVKPLRTTVYETLPAAPIDWPLPVASVVGTRLPISRWMWSSPTVTVTPSREPGGE